MERIGVPQNGHMPFSSCVSATVFLEFWKRRRAVLAYDWDLIDWEEEEVKFFFCIWNLLPFRFSEDLEFFLHSLIIWLWRFNSNTDNMPAFSAALPLRNVCLLIAFFSPQPAGIYLKGGTASRESVWNQLMTNVLTLLRTQTPTQLSNCSLV